MSSGSRTRIRLGLVSVAATLAVTIVDAGGRILPAWFELDDARLVIVVDDADAAYPVTVDPLATSPNWTAESNEAGARFGWSVSSAGDVNGDGYDDVIVGATGYDNGQTDEGRVFMWLGSASGLGPSGDPANADWTAESDQVAALFGNSVSSAGDVNGDGYDDVIVGAPYYDAGQTNEGRVFVWLGSASGLGPSGTPSNAYWTAESDQGIAYFGTSVSCAGDVNGDGYDDVIVGASKYPNGEASEGAAFVWLGSASGLGANGNPANADWRAGGDQASDHFGWSVSSAGDVNGDGYDDVIIGAYGYGNGQSEEGRAFVWFGSASGLGENGTPANADWTAESDQAYAQLGYSVSTAGDLNGDGYDDLLVGAYRYDSGEPDEGVVFVWLGSASGLGPSGNPINADWSASGNQALANLGCSVASAGDLNGDTYDDIIVGAPSYDNGQTEEGRAFVWFGSSSGLGPPGNPANADWTAEGNQASAFFGYSVSPAGDVNGDGYDDVIVSAPLFDNGQTDEGRTYVYYGGTTGADFDGDGDVDEADYARFAACLNGPLVTAPPAGCSASQFDSADLDRDDDVDLADFSWFESCVNGPNMPPGCAW